VPISDTSNNTYGGKVVYPGGDKYGTLADPNQKIVHCMRKWKEEGARKFGVLAVNCESISRELVGMRDPRYKEGNWEAYYYFVVGQRRWAHKFNDEANEYMQQSENVRQTTINNLQKESAWEGYRDDNSSDESGDEDDE
jgi:hypothetical protein